MNNEYSYNSGYFSFRDFLVQTYSAVGIGLLISAAIAFLFNISLPFLYRLFGNGLYYVMIAAVIGELGIAIFFTARLTKMSSSLAWTCYIMYAIMTGISLSLVVAGYTAGSVVMAFVTTAVLFICMSIIGHTTNVDLTRFSFLFSSGLIAMIVISLLNMFIFHSYATDLFLCYAGIILFLGLIAFDIQRLRYIYQECLYDSEMNDRLMVYGAFQLYLDFINLFLRVLRLFGRRRD